MTPPHGTDLKSTAEREAAKTEQEAHMFECWNKQGGPGWDMREKVDKIRLWVAGVTALGMFLNGMGLVILAWWLSTRLPAPSQHRAGEPASLFNRAHAEAKGSTP